MCPMSAKLTRSIQNEAYEHIKKKIMMCEYAPNELLSESVLQEELGCSRTPVREAIRRLEQEGLATVLPKRGILVSGFTINDINAIFEVRMLVEPYALLNYGSALDEGETRRFLTLFQQYQNKEAQLDFYPLDDEFHEFLISCLPNEYLHDLYTRIQTQNARLRVMSGQLIDSRINRTMLEHEEIARICLERNWEQAAEKMKWHLECSRASYFEAIMQNNSGTNLM